MKPLNPQVNSAEEQAAPGDSAEAWQTPAPVIPASSNGGRPTASAAAQRRTTRPARARFSAQERARRKSHGLSGHLTTLVFQPRLFFCTLPATRHWLLVALAALLVVGLVAVRQAAGVGTPVTDGAVPLPGPDFSGGFSAGPVPEDPFAVPLPETPLPEGGGGAGPGAPSATTAHVTAAVTAAAWSVGAWALVAALLLPVRLLRGQPASFGMNLQIAVWASVPVVGLLLVQSAFHAAGGQGTAPGLSAVLPRWVGFAAQTPEVQLLLTSALSQTTLFSLASLTYLYFGARYALGGGRAISLLVVGVWAAVCVIVPVLTGDVIVPQVTL
jgi:hypothetical protein